MHNNIKISEEDIFKFVFNPESLAKDIFEHITQNKEHFASEITFCNEMYSELTTVSDKLSNEVFEKLNKSGVVELFPTNENSSLDQGIKLAAASLQVSTPKKDTSFSDSEMNYLIRLVSVNSQSLLFFFTNKTEVNQVKIKFLPSENEYLILDISQPIEILEETTIQKILIIT